MRRIAWALFAVALLAFVLPFAAVSCGTSSAEPTGAELVLGAEPETSGPDGARLGAIVVDAAGGLATAAFLAFALALVGSLRRWDAGWCALAGAAGVLALIVLDTRGGGVGAGSVQVDAGVGAFLAAFAGAAGVLVVVPAWLRQPKARPYAPAAGLTLIVLAYLLPAARTEVMSVSYADSLELRQPWRSLFWLLPVAAGAVVVARRDRISRDLGTAVLAVFGPCAVVTAHDLWSTWRDDAADVGPAPLLMLAGAALSGSWVFVARRGRAGRPAAVPGRSAPAPAAPPRARSGPGSGGSPPAAP